MASIDAYGGTDRFKYEATGYFRVEKSADRWWLVDPDGNGSLSIALNHLDETNLKYDHNVDIWKKRYGSREKWIAEGVTKDLKQYGFNTVGWTQEYVSGDWGTALDWFGDVIDLGHSTQQWTARDFATAGMPYVLFLRVSEFEDWKGQPVYPDVYSHDFEVWCDYLARSLCVDHADSKNLVGYYLVDIPGWIRHATGRDFPQLLHLDPAARETKVYDIASKYYETITSAIRHYDKNHLILGDRYNGNKGIPSGVLAAMKPFVDVLSVQYFSGPTAEDRQKMRDDLAGWQAECGKPVINADIGNWIATKLNPNRTTSLTTQAERAQDYIAAFTTLLNEPWFIGWHWCAYVENTARGWGIKDPWDEPYTDFVEPVAEFNKSVYDKLAGQARAPVGS